MSTRNNERIRYRYGICLNDNCEKCKTKVVQEIPERKEFVCQNPECGKPLRECPSPKKGGKAKLIVILATVIAILGGAGFGIWKLVLTPNPEKYQISIEPNEITLQAGDTIRLMPIIDSEDAQVTFIWESDDSMTVSISEDGLANAVRIGQAAIILHIKEALTPHDTCWVTVVENDSTIAARNDSIRKAMEDSIKAIMIDSLSLVSKLEGDSLAQVISDSIIKQKIDSMAKAQKKKNKVYVTSKTEDLGYATFKGTWPNDVSGRMIFKTSHLIDSNDPRERMAEPGDYVIGEWSDGHLVQGRWYKADNTIKEAIIIGKSDN